MRALVRRCCKDAMHAVDADIMFVSSMRNFPG